MAFKKSVNFVIQLLVALILFFIIQIPSLFARPLNNETIDKINIISHFSFYIIFFVVIFLLTYISYIKINGKNILEPKIIISNVKFVIIIEIIAIFLETVILYIGNYIFHITTPSEPADNFSDKLLHVHSPLIIILILHLVIVGPILEELLFQSIIQGVILKSLNMYINVFITTLLFLFAHGFSIFSFNGLSLFIPLLSFGLIYLKTKDIKMSCFGHMINSLLVTLLHILYN
ncbi:CPBP family intramembrane metalloprotease [Lactobacillus mellis]|nr:CPBP family intramembrane metalloprotease [Bombilactobacillus mellis]